tara:strand:- start:2303 stop:2680 length:378 start_codon:yes stop_codon:yes gene_type:complete
MGMYTEIFVNVDLKEETPKDVIEVIQKSCDFDFEWMRQNGHPERWGLLFNNGSYYTPDTSVASFTYDRIGNNYSLLGKGDIKNYECEIESFFSFIAPWCEGDFLGYMMYEESSQPCLMFKNDVIK